MASSGRPPSVLAVIVALVGAPVLVIFALAGPVEAAAVLDAAKRKCVPSETAPPAGPYYGGPLIDSHFHMPPPVNGGTQPALGRNVSLAGIACTLHAEETDQVFAFFPVFPEDRYERFINVARNAKRRYPKLFVPFIMPPGRDDVPPTVNARKLTKMLKSAPGLFQGYGEIGLYAIEGREADDYPPDGSMFKKIYRVVRRQGMMVYLHPGEGHQDNLERALQWFPQVDFLVHGEQIESAIDGLMERYQNIYFTANDLYGDQYLLHPGETKGSFLDALRDFGPLLEKDLATWKARIEAHPNQYMWGTDRGDAVWTFDKEVGKTLADYARTFIGRLDPAVQAKFAYENAERLATAARS